MRVFEVITGVLCGFAISAFGVVLASAIAWLALDPFHGPILSFIEVSTTRM